MNSARVIRLILFSTITGIDFTNLLICSVIFKHSGSKVFHDLL